MDKFKLKFNKFSARFIYEKNFGIISSTRASGPSRLAHYANDNGSSSDAKPSAPSQP